jgi:hypothetical protein
MPMVMSAECQSMFARHRIHEITMMVLPKLVFLDVCCGVYCLQAKLEDMNSCEGVQS